MLHAGVTGPSEVGSKKEKERRFGKRPVIKMLIPLLRTCVNRKGGLDNLNTLLVKNRIKRIN